MSPTTIKVALVGGPQYDRLYKRLAFFEKETGHHVEIVFKGAHPELNDYLATTFSPANQAVPQLDLVSTHIKYAPSQAHFLQELDIAKVSEAEQAEFLQSALEASKIHGKLFQVPRMVDSRVLFYRADIFKKLGLAPPQTWKDLLQVARTIREAKLSAPAVHGSDSIMEGYVFPGKLSGLFGTFYELAMMEMSHPEALFDRQDHPVFEEETVAKVLQYMRDCVSQGAVPSNIDEYYFDDVSAMFSEGKVAMVADWPSFYGEMKDRLKVVSSRSEAPVEIKVMRYPTGANTKRSAYSGMHSFAIPTSCRHPEAALQLLKFLVRDDNQWVEASESGSFPTKNKVLEKLATETEKQVTQGRAEAELDSERLKCLMATVQEDMAMFPHSANYPELEDALYPMIQDAMMGRCTPEEAAKAMKAKASSLA